MKAIAPNYRWKKRVMASVIPTEYTVTLPGMSIDDENGFHREVKVSWRGNDRWAVLKLGSCLNVYGEWEFEPSPSNRNDEFKERCRFTLDEALTRAKAFQETRNYDGS